MPVFFLIKCILHTLSITFILRSLLYSSSSALSLSRCRSCSLSRPCCYHFNVVAPSAVICFLVMCQCAREVAWDQLPFFHTSVHIQQMQKRTKVEGREREPYYFAVEAADDTLMNLDHRRSPTQSYIHTSTHTIYVTLLIAPLLFSNTTLCSHFQCVHTHSQHTHTRTHKDTISPDVLSSSLLWAELSHSHRHQPLSKGSWSWETYGRDENGKRHVGVSVMMTVCEAVVMYINLATTCYLPTYTRRIVAIRCKSEQISWLRWSKWLSTIT